MICYMYLGTFLMTELRDVSDSALRSRHRCALPDALPPRNLEGWARTRSHDDPPRKR